MTAAQDQGDGKCADAFPANSGKVLCHLQQGHEGWHEGTTSEQRRINFDTARYVIDTHETVTWEDQMVQVKRALEATRRQQ